VIGDAVRGAFTTDYACATKAFRDARFELARLLFHANEHGNLKTVQVVVRDNNVDQALKVLKKKMQREGIFREMKLRRSYEKPSERRAREKAEAVRRARKLERKRLERDGF
jgi:small subunit ribosomal protein S21